MSVPSVLIARNVGPAEAHRREQLTGNLTLDARNRDKYESCYP
jgi:hypothetical protein